MTPYTNSTRSSLRTNTHCEVFYNEWVYPFVGHRVLKMDVREWFPCMVSMNSMKNSSFSMTVSFTCFNTHSDESEPVLRLPDQLSWPLLCLPVQSFAWPTPGVPWALSWPTPGFLPCQCEIRETVTSQSTRWDRNECNIPLLPYQPKFTDLELNNRFFAHTSTID